MATIQVNGGVLGGENLSGDLEFFTIHTVVALAEGDFGVANSATRNLIEFSKAIRGGAQPVILSLTTATVDLSVAGNRTIYGLGTALQGATTVVHTIKFAIEHAGAFGQGDDALDADIAYSLAGRLNGRPMPFTTTGVTGAGGDIVAIDTVTATTKNTSIKRFPVL